MLFQKLEGKRDKKWKKIGKTDIKNLKKVKI